MFVMLCDLPENTVVDGEIVALDDAGRPNFNFLQYSRSQAKRIHYFVFDLLVYDNHDLMQLPLVERRELLKSNIKFQSPKVRIAEYFETVAATMLTSARVQGLEGVIAKRKNRLYEAGKRSGAWAKFRLNLGQELVIGGYVPGAHGVDSVIVGYHKGPAGTHVWCESAERFCARNPSSNVRETAISGGAELSFREST